MSDELVAALAGAVVGAVEQDRTRRRAQREEMRTALDTAFEVDVQLLAEAARATPCGHLLVLESTAQAKYGLLGVDTCLVVDYARAQLAAVQCNGDQSGRHRQSPDGVAGRRPCPRSGPRWRQGAR